MTIDASRLQVSVQEQERWRRRMSVTVPASVVQEEEARAARQLASRARLKGFRKGKVPTHVIESRFGGSLRREALDRLISDAYRQALAVEQLQPISEGEIEEVNYEPAQDLTFAITFDVQPTLELARLGGFAVERPVRSVTDEQIEAVLARVQEQNGVWQPLEEGQPQDRDLVSVTILKLDEDGDGEEAQETSDDREAREYEFILGQGDAIPDVEAAIKTLAPGESGDFDVTFPDDFPDESKRGEASRVRVALVSRRALEVPDLDDDFAKQVGDFETLAELTSKVREDMEKEAAQQSEEVVRTRLLDLLIDANAFDVPASMVDRYTDGLLGDQEGVPKERIEEFREQIRPRAEQAVKRIMVVERIADTQSLRATEDDIDERVEEIATANETTAAKVYASLQKAGRIEALEQELTEKKVFEFLKEQSEITDAPGA